MTLSGWDGSPSGGVHRRLRTDPAWPVHELPVSHNVLADAPQGWLGILLDGDGRTGSGALNVETFFRT